MTRRLIGPARRRAAGALPKALVVVACLVALGGSAAVIYSQLAPSTRTAAAEGPELEWFCDGCQQAYKAPSSTSLPPCPTCGRVGDLVFRFRCAGCQTVFEGYRRRWLADETRMRFKAPGGEWADELNAILPPRCPKCGSDRAVQVSPPLL